MGQNWKDMEVSKIPMQQVLQMYSFLSSILAIAMAFASNYSMRKEGKTSKMIFQLTHLSMQMSVRSVRL